MIAERHRGGNRSRRSGDQRRDHLALVTTVVTSWLLVAPTTGGAITVQDDTPNGIPSGLGAIIGGSIGLLILVSALVGVLGMRPWRRSRI